MAIQANTTYVASYFAPAGHYAYSSSYFTTAGVDNGVLHALSVVSSYETERRNEALMRHISRYEKG